MPQATKKSAELARLRRNYYRRIAKKNLRPLWEVLDSLVPREPTPRCRPSFWKFDEIRTPLLEARELISAKEAIRRVLILENPAFPGESRVTNALYAGLQLLCPGEIAPAHRHTQSALRFMLQGQGAFTTVNGERHYMSPGDLVLTPGWSWHDHGSEVSEPVIWLDGLDIPIVQMFDAGFSEDADEDQQQVSCPAGDSLARFGSNMLPVGHVSSSKASPVFAYPYACTRDALDRLSSGSTAHAWHGYRMRFINPANGADALPTISTFIQLLPAAFSGGAFRSTDATVYVCVEGRGRTTVGDETFVWSPSDIFVVPSWYPCRHESYEEAVLFSFLDRVVQEQIGCWREASAQDVRTSR